MPQVCVALGIAWNKQVDPCGFAIVQQGELYVLGMNAFTGELYHVGRLAARPETSHLPTLKPWRSSHERGH